MNYLLDTHSFLWAAMQPARLTQSARAALQNPAHDVFVSVISFWEIALKFALGKLHLDGVTPDQFPEVASQMNFRIEEFSAADAATYHRLLRSPHKDPFDRMLVWQCLRRGWTLISADAQLREYEQAGLLLLR